MHLIFGGTFDPVHLGHMQIAQAVCDYFKFSACYFLPNAQPAEYKQTQTPPNLRKAMLEQALGEQKDPRLKIDDRELRRGGHSYSLDTLKEIRGEQGTKAKLFWIIGTDAFNQMTDWHDWERLFEFTNFIVITRRKHPLQLSKALQAYYADGVIKDKNQFLQQANGSIYLFDQINLDISSSAIRQGLKAGQSVYQHLSSQVYRYIHSQDIYKSD